MTNPWVEQYIFKLNPEQKILIDSLRCLIAQYIPNIEETYKYQCPFYCLDKKMFCYLTAPAKTQNIAIGFCNGYLMNDDAKILSNDTKQIRKIIFGNTNKLNISIVRMYLLEALRIHKLLNP